VVKIRLKRQGNKHRPFYRVVVSKSEAGRDGSFIEIIGTYNPILRDKDARAVIKGDRALHWLLEGAQPTETVAYLLKKCGVLEEFFTQRPKARTKFPHLNKAIPATAAVSAVEAPAPAEAPAE
jgi:small subunit ribosomal protein S16